MRADPIPVTEAPYRLETHPGLPQPPVFESTAADRLHRKQRLAAAFRIFARFGFSDGIAGHVTVRDPDHPNTFWVNPFGVHFSDIKVSNLIRCNEQGEVVEGDFPVNAAAFALHANIHRSRPDVMASAHTHAPMGRAWSVFGLKLDPITQDACAFYDSHEVSRDYGGVPVEMGEAGEVTRHLRANKALIMQNHGLVTVGGSVDEAAWWFICMERCCQVQLLAMGAAGGERSRLPMIAHEDALQANAIIGTPFAGWFNFQPLYNRIVREEPDCLL